MKKVYFEIKENIPIAESVFKMVLCGDISGITAPGQFVNIMINGLYLRRPISVCDIEDDTLTIIYKVVGKGTEQMSRMENGKLDILTGLGNGYDTLKSGKNVLLLGGGVGVPPLYFLAKTLINEGKSVTTILGYNNKNDVFFENEFLLLGCKVSVTTVDGSYGIKGYVTDAIPEEYDYFYTCGPEMMLKSVYRSTATDGQFSFEERMGCGFGACMGCSCKTLTGYKRICRDGPVLEKGEILWAD